MSLEVFVLKDENSQCPIPTVWRAVLVDIVKAFQEGDFTISRGIVGVKPILDERARRIASNIASYGAHLTDLPEENWRTSVCQWMIGYWDVMVDLYTIEEGPSDLVMSVRVCEQGMDYAFDVFSVYVP